jgi:hypothetical protein
MKIILFLSINLTNIIIEYCTSLQKKIKNSKIIFYSGNEIDIIDNKSIYIFFGIYYVNYPIINKKNIYYINLEQLTMNGKYTQYNVLTPFLNIINNNKYLNICDYSQGNISILKNYNIKSNYLPYQVNNDEIFNYDKIYNFVVCCTWNSRIQFIYDKIAQKYQNCNSIGNPIKWGSERDNIIFKTKILANIHHREFDYNILEEIRITRCILNKVIVISEYSLEWEKYPLSNYVIFVNYEDMVNKIIDVLDNYDYYVECIYNDFNINNIDIELQKYLDDFINSFDNN